MPLKPGSAGKPFFGQEAEILDESGQPVPDGEEGFLVLKRLSHALRLDHLYIDPPAQDRGIGHEVMRWICAQADAQQLPVELCALKDSDANRFYLRHGFRLADESDWDLHYLRPARRGGPVA